MNTGSKFDPNPGACYFAALNMKCFLLGGALTNITRLNFFEIAPRADFSILISNCKRYEVAALKGGSFDYVIRGGGVGS